MIAVDYLALAERFSEAGMHVCEYAREAAFLPRLPLSPLCASLHLSHPLALCDLAAWLRKSPRGRHRRTPADETECRDFVARKKNMERTCRIAHDGECAWAPGCAQEARESGARLGCSTQGKRGKKGKELFSRTRRTLVATIGSHTRGLWLAGRWAGGDGDERRAHWAHSHASQGRGRAQSSTPLHTTTSGWSRAISLSRSVRV